MIKKGSTAFIFPGQGSQAIGMGMALAGAFPCAREVLQEVDDALSFKLSKVMAEGPDDKLTATENAQPAIMACSMAALRVLQKEMGLKLVGTVLCVSGHSLGEYSALAAAGSLTLADTARLLQIRGRAMQQAVPKGEGAMAAIIGLDFAAVKALCDEASATGDVCEIANYNSDQQIVISGSAEGIETGMRLAKEKGAKRALPLPVSAPFHCSLMQPAADVMQKALAATKMQSPEVPLYANITAQEVEDVTEIKSLLVKQVTGMVRWRESVDAMVAAGVDTFIEVGHGTILSGLVKRIAPDAVMLAAGQPQDFDKLASAA